MASSEKQDNRPHVVIVGGGFGGLDTVRALRNAPVRITLIDRTNHHLFQPLLYQVATAGLSPADIAAPIRSIVSNQSNVRVLMAEVIGVDTRNQRVQLEDRAVPYDYLVLATGAHHSYFGHDEWEEFAPGLKSLGDATAIRRRILQAFETAEMQSDPNIQRDLLTFILVGGGPTGVEMAGAIAELAKQALRADFRNIDPTTARILLVEASPRILNAFPEDLAQEAQQKLESMGVEVRTGARVEKIDRAGVIVAGERIPSHSVIWTAGVTASPAGKWLNAPMDKAGRVKVLPDLSVPEHPNIYVIGDTAAVEQDGKPLPGVAQVAMQGGHYVGKRIGERVRGQQNTTPFRYFDKGNMATVGRAFAIADMGKLKFGGFVAWVLWLCIHILYLIGFRNRILVMIQWTWAYFTYQRGARLITPNETSLSANLAERLTDPPAPSAETETTLTHV